MYQHGFSSDTPNFIIDNLEDGGYNEPPAKTAATTDAVRYQPVQLEPNENGRGSLLKKDDEEEKNGNGTTAGYRIRTL
jgi:hypothetical protein